MASKVFISWGGNLSKQLAEEVKNWLPSVLQFVKPYFSPDDIEKGTHWESDIASELASSQIGIICLTRDNINRPWILFEAGALSKNFGKAKVCTVLFNVDSTTITGPLTCFQATKFDKADFKKLIKTINETGGDSKLDSKVLDDVFEMWWPQLEDKINKTIKDYKEESQEEERSERAILEELLELTRMTAKRIPREEEDSKPYISPRAMDDLITGLEYLLRILDDVKDPTSFRRCFKDFYSPSAYLCSKLGTSAQMERLSDINERMRMGLLERECEDRT